MPEIYRTNKKEIASYFKFIENLPLSILGNISKTLLTMRYDVKCLTLNFNIFYGY